MAAPIACTHSRNLFVLENGSPMRFYARPGPLKQQLSPLIWHGGGVMCRLQEPDALLLVKPGEAQGPQYISVDYVTDCVERDERLDVKDYMLGKISAHRLLEDKLETGCKKDFGEGDEGAGQSEDQGKEGNQNTEHDWDDFKGTGHEEPREAVSEKDSGDQGEEKAENKEASEDECREVDNIWKQKNQVKYQRRVSVQTDEKGIVTDGATLIRTEFENDAGDQRPLNDGGCPGQVERLKTSAHQQGEESLTSGNGHDEDSNNSDRKTGDDFKGLKNGMESVTEGEVAVVADDGGHGREVAVVADDGGHGREVAMVADDGGHGREVAVVADDGDHGREVAVVTGDGGHGGVVAGDGGHREDGRVAADDGGHRDEGGEVDGKDCEGNPEGNKTVMEGCNQEGKTVIVAEAGEDGAPDKVGQKDEDRMGHEGDRGEEENMIDRQDDGKKQKNVYSLREKRKQSEDDSKNDVQQKRQKLDNVHQIPGTSNTESKKNYAAHLQETVTPDSPSFRPSGRTFFTKEEDMAILSYLRDNIPARGTVSGVVLWKEMEEKQVVKRTWQAIKDRYRKHLAKKYPFYTLPKSPSPLQKKTTKNEVSSPRSSARKNRKISTFTSVKCSTPKRSKVSSSDDRPGGNTEDEEEAADQNNLHQHQDTAEPEAAIKPPDVPRGFERVPDMIEDHSNDADNSDSGELCIFEIANMEFEAEDSSEAVACKQGPGLKEFVMEEDSVPPESQTQVAEVSSSPDVVNSEGFKEAVHGMMTEFNLSLCDITQALIKNSGEVGATKHFLRAGSRPDGYPIWMRKDDLDLEKGDPKIQKRLVNKYGADNVAKRMSFLAS